MTGNTTHTLSNWKLCMISRKLDVEIQFKNKPGGLVDIYGKSEPVTLCVA